MTYFKETFCPTCGARCLTDERPCDDCQERRAFQLRGGWDGYYHVADWVDWEPGDPLPQVTKVLREARSSRKRTAQHRPDRQEREGTS